MLTCDLVAFHFAALYVVADMEATKYCYFQHYLFLCVFVPSVIVVNMGSVGRIVCNVWLPHPCQGHLLGIFGHEQCAESPITLQEVGFNIELYHVMPRNLHLTTALL